MAKKKKVKKERKLVRIKAEKLGAGDTIALREGSVRKFYHVCEIMHIGRGEDMDIYVTWNVPSGFKSRHYDPGEKVVVRRWV